MLSSTSLPLLFSALSTLFPLSLSPLFSYCSQSTCTTAQEITTHFTIHDKYSLQSVLSIDNILCSILPGTFPSTSTHDRVFSTGGGFSLLSSALSRPQHLCPNFQSLMIYTTHHFFVGGVPSRKEEGREEKKEKEQLGSSPLLLTYTVRCRCEVCLCLAVGVEHTVLMYRHAKYQE